MATKHNFKQIIRRYERLKRSLAKTIGNEAVNFAKDSFKKQGFEESPGRVNKWKKRKPGAPRNKGRNILSDTGQGKRSIRRGLTTRTQVRIVTDTPYMKAHNEGARIRGRARVKAHRRRTASGRRVPVKSHHRQVDFWLPRRRFIGPSGELNRRINRRIRRGLIKVFR